MKGVSAGMVTDDDDKINVRDTADGQLLLDVRLTTAKLTIDEALLLARQIKLAVGRAHRKVSR